MVALLAPTLFALVRRVVALVAIASDAVALNVRELALPAPKQDPPSHISPVLVTIKCTGRACPCPGSPALETSALSPPTPDMSCPHPACPCPARSLSGQSAWGSIPCALWESFDIIRRNSRRSRKSTRKSEDVTDRKVRSQKSLGGAYNTLSPIM
jgi:hypothetical protein